jgi:hypothetical protein
MPTGGTHASVPPLGFFHAVLGSILWKAAGSAEKGVGLGAVLICPLAADRGSPLCSALLFPLGSLPCPEWAMEFFAEW